MGCRAQSREGREAVQQEEEESQGGQRQRRVVSTTVRSYFISCLHLHAIRLSLCDTRSRMWSLDYCAQAWRFKLFAGIYRSEIPGHEAKTASCEGTFACFNLGSLEALACLADPGDVSVLTKKMCLICLKLYKPTTSTENR